MSILDRFRLDGQVAVVTGASRGLGASFACALAEAGADLVLTSTRPEGMAATAAAVEERGRNAFCVAADLSDPGAPARLMAEATAQFGVLHILVNNAGISTIHPATRETAEEFQQVLALNLVGTYLCCGEFAKQAPRDASIINVSSNIASRGAGLPQAAYASSKAGIEAMSRDLAAQWGSRKGIRVNVVAPGYFETSMTDDLNQLMTAATSSVSPLGRAGTQEEAAAAVVFLASRASSYITAECLTVDGGLSKAGSMFGALSLG